MYLPEQTMISGIPTKLPEGQLTNTGNFIHSTAARKIIRFGGQANIRTLWSESQIEQFRERYRHVVLVEANAIKFNQPNEVIDQAFRDLVKNLEATDMTICYLGLGSQIDQIEGKSITDLKMSKDCERALKIIAERCTAIGVRGAFTADMLRKIGIKNVMVTGCQSCFMSLSRIPIMPRNPRFNQADLGIGVSLTKWGKEYQLLRMAMKYGFFVFGQTEILEWNILHSEAKLGKNPENISFNSNIAHLIKQGFFSDQDYINFIRNHFKMFYDVDDWLSFLRNNIRFVFGTRFHGNMAALQAGVPALWIGHDMRVRELCDYLGLPMVHPSILEQPIDLERFMDACDYTNYASKYTNNYDTLRTYLDINATPHNMVYPYFKPDF